MIFDWFINLNMIGFLQDHPEGSDTIWMVIFIENQIYTDFYSTKDFLLYLECNVLIIRL